MSSCYFVQIIDGAENCVYDIFQTSETDFRLLFPNDTDIAFAEEFRGRPDLEQVEAALSRLWTSRVPKPESRGIHGTIFFGLESKRTYYPTLKDEEAANPDGTLLRPPASGPG